MKWTASTVKSILTNEKYKGDALLQKTFTPDYLTKKTKKNDGQIPQYYVENSHPAIITAEVFDAVQTEMERRQGTKRSVVSAEVPTDQRSGIRPINTAGRSTSVGINTRATANAPHRI